MKKRRILQMLGCILAILIVLSGCNENTNKSEEDDASHREDHIDYSDIDLSGYYGEYYSSNGMYGIILSQGVEEKSFYVELYYTTGVADSGYVVPGEKTLLDGSTTITIKPLENGTVHITLNSAIHVDGDFDEDLIKGNLLDALGLYSASLLMDMNEADRFRYLCQIERNCIDLTVQEIVRHPDHFCNGTIYRIPGVVTWADHGEFLLEITDQYENDTIICRSSIPVSEGDEICVYGNGNEVNPKD